MYRKKKYISSPMEINLKKIKVDSVCFHVNGNNV